MMTTIAKGSRVGAVHRTSVNVLQPHLSYDHRGTVLAIVGSYVKVRWNFGRTYWERAETLFVRARKGDLR